MPFHLLATKTVAPTLKSAREFCSKPQPPAFLITGTPDDCYKYAMEELGGRNRMPNDLMGCIRGMPVFATSDWTYWLVEDKVDR